jgi:hypothetical protein
MSTDTPSYRDRGLKPGLAVPDRPATPSLRLGPALLGAMLLTLVTVSGLLVVVVLGR